MSSAAVQQHNTQQQYHQASPSQSDRYADPSSYSPSRRAGTGHASSPSHTYNSPSSAPMSSPRGQEASTASYGSPTQPLSNSTYQQWHPDGVPSGPAVPLPVRTSSQQAPTTSATSSPYDSRAYASRSQQSGAGYGTYSDSERERASERQVEQRSPQADTSSGRSRNAPTQSRSTNAVGQPPVDTSLPRENSAIINRIVVDDPHADIARERARVAEATPNQRGTEPAMVDPTSPPESEQRHRSRQEHLRQPSHRKEVKFGDYILGQTLGEGEFGKVKMGWKKDSSVQVAIKLIRKESLQSNNTRLPKIYREIGILRDLQHPNIVRLHEFVETERHMGIILEYASGGELFDYILNHRYLKDPAARRLFAQLVSGVGYLHKKGIVHRDLKLENLLLDRNKNIIITDFGFANTFDPNDDLPEEIEDRIGEKDFVRSQGYDKVNEKGIRRGDLMQTSCGSPCYAAPELVVSDGLYTGRKVDVWSCGVILYAMLAGYLPFDDDPANPEGDNINLLYKYITSTPLTFPEYVTPHARDLLRRILVPSPRKRADLFEVARHSWLSEYSHVVGFIGSSTKSDRDIAAAMQDQEPALGRSASVRGSASAVQKQPPHTADGEQDPNRTQRDAKRRTVQLEYVAPKVATARGEASPTGPTPMTVIPTGAGRTRARGDAQGPIEVSQAAARSTAPAVPRKEIPDSSMSMPPPIRYGRDQSRAASDSPAAFSNSAAASMSRPNTSGTLGSARLPSRGNSYSQPAVPTPTNANAQGHFSQPKSGSGYIISGPGNEQGQSDSRPISQQNLAQYQQQQMQQPDPASQRGHKRSSTLGSIGDRILGRSSSRSRRTSQQQDSPKVLEKRERKYPPVSMRNALPNDDGVQPRPSMESTRRTSFGFNRKTSEVPTETTNKEKRSSRRFSFLPGSFSMNSFTGKSKDPAYPDQSYRPESKGMAFGRGQSRSPSHSTTNSTSGGPVYQRSSALPPSRDTNSAPQMQQQPRYDKALPPHPQSRQGSSGIAEPPPPPFTRKQYRDDGYGGNLLEPQQQSAAGQGVTQNQEPVERFYTPNNDQDEQSYSQGGTYGESTTTGYGQSSQMYPPGSSQGYDNPSSSFGRTEALPQEQQDQIGREGNFRRDNNRKFEYDHGHAGSSSTTRRVMDFFRRRGKERGEV